jgi:hypothetical protein
MHLKSVQWKSNDTMFSSQQVFEKHNFTDGKYALIVKAETMSGTSVSDSVNITVIPYDAVDVCCAGGWDIRAAYWKDGKMFEVPGAKQQFQTVSCYNGDIFFLERTWGSGDTAFYWKNNSRIILPSKKLGILNSMVISDSGIYICGSDRSDYSGLDGGACYWLNGKQTYLSNKMSGANCIALSYQDVYISGAEYSDSAKRTLPCYWKNLIKGPIPTPVYNTTWEAKWIGVHDNEIWIAGIDNFPIEDYSVQVGWLWNRGEKKYLDDGSGISPLVNPEHGIAISSFSAGQKGVYAVGFVSATYKSYLWADGTPVEWKGPDGQPAAAHAVYVLYNHVFVAGAYVKNNKWVLCYWRNNKCFNVMELDSTGPNSMLRIYAIGAEVKPESTWVKYYKGNNKDRFSVQNNPILSATIQKENLVLEIALRKNGKVDMEMLDVSGRIVFKKAMGTIGAGRQHAKISLSQAGMRIYAVRLRSDGQSWTRKVRYAK